MIAVVDYGAGNLQSVKKALDFIGAPCIITKNADEIQKADKVILPGVGSFGDAMDSTHNSASDRKQSYELLWTQCIKADLPMR